MKDCFGQVMAFDAFLLGLWKWQLVLFGMLAAHGLEGCGRLPSHPANMGDLRG